MQNSSLIGLEDLELTGEISFVQARQWSPILRMADPEPAEGSEPPQVSKTLEIEILLTVAGVCIFLCALCNFSLV